MTAPFNPAPQAATPSDPWSAAPAAAPAAQPGFSAAPAATPTAPAAAPAAQPGFSAAPTAPAAPAAQPVHVAGATAENPFGNAFAAPSSLNFSDGPKLAEFSGEILVLRPRAFDPAYVTKRNPEGTPRGVADVLVCSGPRTGEFIQNMGIFAKYIANQIGQAVSTVQAGETRLIVGRLGQGTATPGNSAPWQLFDLSPEEIPAVGEIARAQGLIA